MIKDEDDPERQHPIASTVIAFEDDNLSWVTSSESSSSDSDTASCPSQTHGPEVDNASCAEFWQSVTDAAFFLDDV